MIIAGDAGRRDRFPVKLYMLEDVDPEVIPLAPPFLAEVDGQRAVVSIFGGALASVYLDGSPPDDIGVLGANEPLLVASMSWRGSSLREIAKQNVLENYLRFGNPFPKQTRRSLQTLKKK